MRHFSATDELNVTGARIKTPIFVGDAAELCVDKTLRDA
jgi:nicotinamidase-related amidase